MTAATHRIGCICDECLEAHAREELPVPGYEKTMRAARQEARRRWGRTAVVRRGGNARDILIAARAAADGQPTLIARGRTLAAAWQEADRAGVPVHGGAWLRRSLLPARRFVVPCNDHADCEPVLCSNGIADDDASGLRDLVPAAALEGHPGDFEIVVFYRPRTAP